MSSNTENFISEIKKQILEETKRSFGESAYNRWRDPFNMGSIENPDGYAQLSGGCGDSMQIFLRFENGKVKDAKFQTDGCGSSVVCGSYAAEMSLDKYPDELLNITGDAILKIIGGVPKQDEHCAIQAERALKEALNDYLSKK